MIYKVTFLGSKKVRVNDFYDMSLDTFIQACRDRDKELTRTLLNNNIP